MICVHSPLERTKSIENYGILKKWDSKIPCKSHKKLRDFIKFYTILNITFCIVYHFWHLCIILVYRCVHFVHFITDIYTDKRVWYGFPGYESKG